MKRAYAPFGALIEPAQGHAEPWRTAIGLLVGFFIYLALCSGFLTFLRIFDVPGAQSSGTPGMLLVQLGCLGFMGIAAGVVVHVFHARRARTIFGDFGKAPRDALRAGIGVLGLLLFVYAVSQLVRPLETLPGRDWGAWLRTLPLALVLLAWQVIGEEMVFRGYLQQQIAARFLSPWVWMGVPSVLFAALHFSVSDFGPNAAAVAIWAGLFGLVLSDLTARTGSLGAAIGVHFANNVMALLVVSLPGPTAALALFVFPFSADSPELLSWLVPAEFVLVMICWLAARVVLRR